MSLNVSDPSSVPQVSGGWEGQSGIKPGSGSIVLNVPENVGCRMMGVIITTCLIVGHGVPKGSGHYSPAGDSLDCAVCIVLAGWVTSVALHRDPVWDSSKGIQQQFKHFFGGDFFWLAFR